VALLPDALRTFATQMTTQASKQATVASAAGGLPSGAMPNAEAKTRAMRDRRIDNPNQRRCIIVAGMHRSGTSAMTRVLGLLGATLPSRLLPASRHNEPGYWESPELLEANDAFLAEIGSSWHDVRPLSPSCFEGAAADRYIERVVETLSKDVGESPLAVIKDPRISRLIPLWKRIVPKVGMSPSFVIMVRNPLEVAASLWERDHFSEETSMLLWLRYLLDAEGASRGLPRVFIRYDHLLSDWKRCARTIGTALAVEWPSDRINGERAIDGFLSARFRHHTFEDHHLAERANKSPWIAAAYRAIKDGDPGDIDQGTLNEIAAELRAADSTYLPILDERDDTVARTTALAAELQGELNGTKELLDRLRAETDDLRRQLLAEREAANHSRADVDAIRAEISDISAELAAERQWRAAVEAQLTSLSRRRRRRRPLPPKPYPRLAAASHFASWLIRLPPRVALRYAATYRALARRDAFDASFYTEKYADVRIAGVDPLAHYVEFGSRERRAPNRHFDVKTHLAEDPSLTVDGVNVLLHSLDADRARRLAVQPPSHARVSYLRRVSHFASWLLKPPFRQRWRYAADYFELRRSGSFDAAAYSTRNADVRRLGLDPLMHYVEFGRREGRSGARQSTDSLYDEWIATNDSLTGGDRGLIRQHIETFRHQPQFSIVLDATQANVMSLSASLASVARQLYGLWDVCITISSSLAESVDAAIDAVDNLRANATVIPCATGSTAARLSEALNVSAGDWLVPLQVGDVLSDHALYLIANEINVAPESVVIYCDNDWLDAHGRRHSPYFKPDWDHDLFLGRDFVQHGASFCKSAMRSLGGFHGDHDGVVARDLVLRVLEAHPDALPRHIPFILCHARSSAEHEMATDSGRAEVACRIVNRHFRRTQEPAEAAVLGKADFLRITRKLHGQGPLASVIVPTKDNGHLLGACLDDLFTKTEYGPLEIVIVDNGTTDAQALDLLERVRRRPGVVVIDEPGAFNFAHLCNVGVAASSGEVCVLLNNDVRVMRPDWLAEMISHAVRGDVGAVGAKLYYPDSTLQHGGVILGLGGVAGHAHRFADADSPGYFGRLLLTHNLSAVTAACLATRRAVYDEAGGFDEVNLPVAYNDVDFCIRVREAGYKIIWTPAAELYHHESVSRGRDETGHKAARYAAERKFMQTRWGKILERDPFYNPNLSLTGETFDPARESRSEKPWVAASETASSTAWPRKPSRRRPVSAVRGPDLDYVDNDGRVNALNVVVLSGRPNTGKSSIAKALRSEPGWVTIQTDGIFAHKIAPTIPNLSVYWTYAHRPEGQLNIGRYINSAAYDHRLFLRHLTDELRTRLRETPDAHTVLLEGYVFESNRDVPAELGYPPERVLSVAAEAAYGRYFVDGIDVTDQKYDAVLTAITDRLRRECINVTLPRSHYQNFASLGIEHGDGGTASDTASKYAASHLDDLIAPTTRFVDVGSNAGYFCFRAAQGSGARIAGVDVLSMWPRIASHINNSIFHLRHVIFYERDAIDFLAANRQEFDVVHCASTFHYFRERQVPFLRAARDALADGGTLVLEIELADTGGQPETVQRARGVDSTPCFFPNRAMFLEQIASLFRIEAEFASPFQRGSFYDRVYFHLR
jgi:O-antigen biosynthesis protein